MYFYTLDNKKLKIGKQNFILNTVPVEVDGIEVLCDMFSDEEGDIGFYYDDEEIYFSHLDTK